MLDYQTLTSQHIEQLRAERLQALEADHARTVLLLAETPDAAELANQLTELERRIAVHRFGVNPDVDVEPDLGGSPLTDLAVTNGHRST